MITLQEIINSLASLSKEETKRVIIHSLRGKYSNLATSSDDFADRKQAEVALEN
jgi:hypothetical protein